MTFPLSLTNLQEKTKNIVTRKYKIVKYTN
jgi:hypothetical protein